MLGARKARVNGSGRQTDGIVQMTGYGISVERSPSAFRFEAPCENSRIVGNPEAIVSYRKNRARTIRLGLETFAQRPRLSSSGRACALADKISSMLLEERVARPVTEREAVQLARDLYGLEVAAKSLPGEYDDNFHLTPVGAGPSGSRDGVSAEQGDAAGFVLKVMHPARERSFIDMQCRALQHLAQRAPQLTLPRVRLNNNGQPFAAIAAPDGSERLVWLLTYVPGTMLAKARPHSPELLQSLGRFLGEMNAGLADFAHAAARRRSARWSKNFSHSTKARLCRLCRSCGAAWFMATRTITTCWWGKRCRCRGKWSASS